MIELLSWYPLAGLAAIWLLWKFSRNNIALLTPRRRLISFALRSTILVLIVLALCDPRFHSTRQREFVIWLVDVSRSVGQNAIQQFEKTFPQLNKDHAIIAFGGKNAEITDTSALNQLVPSTLDDQKTSLSRALEYADATFPLGYSRTVVLLSDGLETEGNARETASRLAQKEVRIHVLPVERPDQPEALVRAIQAPRVVAEREPIRLVAEVMSNRESKAELAYFRNGVKIATRSVDLKPGLNRFDVEHSAGTDRLAEFSASITMPGDTIADNNQAATIVQTEGRSRVLLVSDKPDQSRYLAQALQQEGISLEIRPAAGAPQDLADLQNYDLLILDNVPATDLAPAQLDLFGSYTRDFGGGFLMLGGDQSFGLGGYFRSAVEEILPVQCNFEKEKENPSLGLMLVIDRSGSMTGEKIEMAKQAAKSAVELLSQQDYVGVVGFDHEAFWVFEMQSATDTSSMQNRIAEMEPGGGTDIASGMELGYSGITSCPAKIKHMIVLTDGISDSGPLQELTRRMASEKITVSTVAVGTDADVSLLEQIAQWGDGRHYLAENPASIPQIFAKETMTASKSALHETPFLAQVIHAPEFLEGIDFTSSPFLLGYVTTKLKPTAELWLATERAEPLLATWRYGLGQAAAFTSDARNRWGVEWLKWDAFSRFWAQTVRKLSRPAALKQFPVTFEKQPDGYQITVDVAREDGSFQTGLDGEMALAGPDHTSAKVPLTPTGPGQLRGFIPAAATGHYHANLILRSGGNIIGNQYAGVSLGYPDEFSLQPADTTLLSGIAMTTGGIYGATPEELARPDTRSARYTVELWPWLVGLALLLFVADVGFRRWPEEVAAPATAVREKAQREPAGVGF